MMKSNNNKINFVAEVGCNHQGNFNLVLKMIDQLKNFCNVDYVKFQKRNNKELLDFKREISPTPSEVATGIVKSFPCGA